MRLPALHELPSPRADHQRGEPVPPLAGHRVVTYSHNSSIHIHSLLEGEVEDDVDPSVLHSPVDPPVRDRPGNFRAVGVQLFTDRFQQSCDLCLFRTHRFSHSNNVKPPARPA